MAPRSLIVLPLLLFACHAAAQSASTQPTCPGGSGCPPQLNEKTKRYARPASEAQPGVRTLRADITRAQYRRMQAINLEAPFFLTQALLPLLSAARAPVVVQLVDNAYERPMNKYAHYMLSKAGAGMLVKALAVELGPKVRVCGVAPGAVAFPEWWTEAQKDEVLRRVPLKRTGSPEDIARAVRFVVEHDYLSGVILPVDGGRQAVF